eukprot:4680298-Prymnesium_polylepis.1
MFKRRFATKLSIATVEVIDGLDLGKFQHVSAAPIFNRSPSARRSWSLKAGQSIWRLTGLGDDLRGMRGPFLRTCMHLRTPEDSCL